MIHWCEYAFQAHLLFLDYFIKIKPFYFKHVSFLFNQTDGLKF
jgi:hypothetical protein